jgi:hypothetical protein
LISRVRTVSLAAASEAGLDLRGLADEFGEQRLDGAAQIPNDNLIRLFRNEFTSEDISRRSRRRRL